MPDIIAEKYEVMETIGRGGMGTVYKARQTNLDRIVAIKMLSEELASDPEFRARFQQEATVVARLNHPNIVQIHDIEVHGNTFCIIMEYVDGENLQAKIDRDVTLPENEIVTIGAQVARALAYAHSRGVIHRDIKPDNIHVTPKGEAKVMDFGIARYTDSKLKTQTGISMGTPKFMSPEQVTGKNVDGQTDLYSLGVCLYYCLAGRPPFDGENAISVATRHLYEQPEPPSKLNASISPAVEKVVLHAMEKQKANRYATGYDMADALESTLGTKTPIRNDAEADERFGGDATLRMPAQTLGTPIPGMEPVAPEDAANEDAPVTPAATANLTPLRTHSVPELAPDFRTPRQELQSLDTARGLKKSLVVFGGLVVLAAVMLILLVVWLRKPEPDPMVDGTGAATGYSAMTKYDAIMAEVDDMVNAGRIKEARAALMSFKSQNLGIPSEQLLLLKQKILGLENMLPVTEAEVLFDRRNRTGNDYLGDKYSGTARNALGYAYLQAARDLYESNPNLSVSTSSLLLINSKLDLLKGNEEKDPVTQEKRNLAEQSFSRAHAAAENNSGTFPSSVENDLIQAVELDYTNPNYWLALGAYFQQHQQIDDARVMYMEAKRRTQVPEQIQALDERLRAIAN